MTTTGSLPDPKGKVVNFDHITTMEQASDYSLAGFHAATTKASKSEGATGRLWSDAASAYAAAYAAISGLAVLPGPDSVQKAKGFLHDANHLSDQASAAK